MHDGEQSIEEIKKRNYRRYTDLVRTFVLKAYEKLEQVFGVYFTGARKQVKLKVWDFISFGHIIKEHGKLRVLIAKP